MKYVLNVPTVIRAMTELTDTNLMVISVGDLGMTPMVVNGSTMIMIIHTVVEVAKAISIQEVATIVGHAEVKEEIAMNMTAMILALNLVQDTTNITEVTTELTHEGQIQSKADTLDLLVILYQKLRNIAI